MGAVHGGKSGGHKHIYTQNYIVAFTKCEHKVQKNHEKSYNWNQFWTDQKKKKSVQSIW